MEWIVERLTVGRIWFRLTELSQNIAHCDILEMLKNYHEGKYDGYYIDDEINSFLFLLEDAEGIYYICG